jgi:hypothetical protein
MTKIKEMTALKGLKISESIALIVLMENITTFIGL